MIQIPLEIGDTILAGRFKNKKIKVNEIGTDDFGSPTINGRSILKIRIPKLYQKQENEMKTSIKESSPLKIGDSGIITDKNSMYKGKQGTIVSTVGRDWLVTVLVNGKEQNVVVSKNGLEKSKNLKESINPFQKSPLEVKIKQTDGSWHIYLQTVDGEECLTMTGWGTKEQAEHAAMMKGYSFDANKSNETPTRDTPKYTGYEKVRSEKPEELKLSKEKTIQIKLESMMRQILGKKKL